MMKAIYILGFLASFIPLLTARADLVHHWPLDERSGLEAADLASGWNGILANFGNNDDTQWVDGKIGGALSQALGTGDPGTGPSYRNHLTANLPSLMGGFTIMMWIRPGEIVWGPGEYQLFTSPGDIIGFTIYNDTFQGKFHNRILLFWDGSLNHIVVGTTRLTPGVWYHVAVTSTGIGGERQLFVNGTAEKKNFFVASGGVDVGNADGWPAGGARIGAFNNVGGRWHDSIFDDVRLYDTALGEDEILQVYNSVPRDQFIRGDANLNGLVEMGDVLKIIFRLFEGEPVTCDDALDADDSGALDVTDAIRLLDYLFKGGGHPGIPFPVRGTDPTGDPLNCLQGLQ